MLPRRIALARPSAQEVEEALNFMKGLVNEKAARGADVQPRSLRTGQLKPYPHGALPHRVEPERICLYRLILGGKALNKYSCNRSVPVKSRRDFLEKSSFGFGSIALSYLLNSRSVLGSTSFPNENNPLAVKSPQFPAKAKSVIFIFLQGGPSQVDTFDPKPELAKLDGQLLRSALGKGCWVWLRLRPVS
jgi:hypothetical protein